MKQLIAFGNGWLCLSAQGSILGLAPRIPGCVSAPEPPLTSQAAQLSQLPCWLDLFFPNTFYFLLSPALCHTCCLHRLAAREVPVPARAPPGDAPAPELPAQHRAWVAPYPWERVVVLLSQHIIAVLCDSHCGSLLTLRVSSAQRLCAALMDLHEPF